MKNYFIIFICFPFLSYASCFSCLDVKKNNPFIR